VPASPRRGQCSARSRCGDCAAKEALAPSSGQRRRAPKSTGAQSYIENPAAAGPPQVHGFPHALRASKRYSGARSTSAHQGDISHSRWARASRRIDGPALRAHDELIATLAPRQRALFLCMLQRIVEDKTGSGRRCCNCTERACSRLCCGGSWHVACVDFQRMMVCPHNSDGARCGGIA
jgi:hypothetical protein